MHRLRLARLRRHVLTAVGACLLVAGCGDDAGQAVSRPSDPVEPHECDAAEGSELDATLPREAVDGYRRDDLALWHIPGDQTAIWLVSADGVERWPAGETPLCS
jgi:hypothetical protein